MDQVRNYLTFALDAAFLVCFALLLWQLLIHRQWRMALLSIGFAFACGGGFLFALIVGWQEAANWKIKKLMRWYSVLLVLWFVVSANNLFRSFMAPSPPADLKAKARQKAMVR
jgi:hypothetical protein